MNEPSDNPTSHAPADARDTTFEASWVDAHGTEWRVVKTDDALALHAGNENLCLPRTTWANDIYIASHDDRYVVRFETKERSLAFVLTSEQAEPFLTQIGRTTHDTPDTDVDPEPTRSTQNELLWPKVSPLAVWALICSSLCFVPAVGLLFAVATGVLLLAHQRTVPSSTTWRHSRMLCVAALIFLTTGLALNTIATINLNTNIKLLDLPEDPNDTSTAPSPQRPSTLTASAPRTALASSVLDKEINWALVTAGLIIILLSLTVHEAAHAITAWWLGDDFARRLGRVTLNPLSHLDPVGSIVLPVVLYLFGGVVFGWAKPVPIRTEVLDRPRRGHILISLAGPGANLLLAAASLMLLLALGCLLGHFAPQATVYNYASFDISHTVTASGFAMAPTFAAICTVLKLSFIINTFLAFFNLIPIPPLDGSWVLEHMFPRTLGPLYNRIRPYGFLIFVAVLYTGAFKYLLMPAMLAMTPGFAMLEWCVVF